MICEQVQMSLEAADGVLSRDEQNHLGQCAQCGAHSHLLEGLEIALRDDPAQSLLPAVIHRSHTRALHVMRSQVPADRMGREFGLAVALALLAYPLILVQSWLVALGGEALLGWLPASLLYGLGFVYFGTLALAVGTLYAAIPVLAGWAHFRRMETP